MYQSDHNAHMASVNGLPMYHVSHDRTHNALPYAIEATMRHIPASITPALGYEYPSALFPARVTPDASSLPITKQSIDTPETRPKKRTKHNDSIQPPSQPILKPLANSRKRPCNDDDLDRKRGRPRVDTADETKAEKRKTQIRIAQRAYRGRKEETITKLTKENEDLKVKNVALQEILANMYEFAGKDEIMKLRPEFATMMEESRKRFMELSASENVAPLETKDDDLKEIKSEFQVSRSITESPLPVEPHQDINSHNAIDSRPTSSSSSSSFSPDHEIRVVDVKSPLAMPVDYNDNAQVPFVSPTHMERKASGRASQNQPAISIDNAQPWATFLPQNNASYSQELPYKHLRPPTSFAHNETSFARRLTRLTAESAFTLLSLEAVFPRRFNEVFAFCLRFETRTQIHARLKVCLDKAANESTYSWRQPFLHLNGIGTYYPNYDASTLQMAPRVRTGMSMGPWDERIISVREELLPDYHIDMPGFRGHHFDPNDVESYLTSKGIDLSSNPDIVVVDLDEIQFADDSTEVTLSNETSPRTPALYPIIPPGVDSNHCLQQFMQPDTVKPNLFEEGFMMQIDNDFQHQVRFDAQEFEVTNAQPHGMDTNRITPSIQISRPKRTVPLDIGLLVAELTSEAVCLGRSPGFKPVSVESALRRAIVASSSVS